MHLLKLGNMAVVHDHMLATILGDCVRESLLQSNAADDACHRQAIVCRWVEGVEFAVPASSVKQGRMSVYALL